MSNRSQIVWAATAALALAAVASTALYLSINNGQSKGTILSSLVGGPFKLKTHDGYELSDKDLRGKPFAIFFGFTHCPEVCPTSMLELGKLMERLGPDADRMRYLFVTVDPERDTAEHLKEYLSNFDKRLIGLVGTPKEINEIAKAYRVYYEKVPTSGDYTINHTATVYLMNSDGKLASTLAYGEDMDVSLQKLKRLIGLD
jgi:protein SCO1/2